MYLELRTWKGSWLAGQPAIPTRTFPCQIKSAVRVTANAGEMASAPDRAPARFRLSPTPARVGVNLPGQ